jgi:hypothetical protein
MVDPETVHSVPALLTVLVTEGIEVHSMQWLLEEIFLTERGERESVSR